ncbi:hypothetical protein [Kitasatospora sp. NPDC059571]|uniref:hypothetical protein n=1 Tax=Kitasatospora sp. NPDC059571 TaxID=3346871 RepID=UPI0036920BED
MPQRADLLPQGLTGILQAIKDIRQDIRELRAARRLEAASIGAGGLTVTGAGYLTVMDADGSVLLLIGGIEPYGDGTPQRGIALRRADGTLALSVSSTSGSTSDPQGLVIRDARGNVLVAEDVSGGLARPWGDIPMYPAKSTNWLTTTNASYEVLWRGVVDARNPKLAVSGWAVAAASSGGNVRVKVNGTVLGSPVAVTTTSSQWTIGPLAHGVAIGSDLTVEIEAQLTSGAGPVSIGVHHARGQQT